MNSACRNLAQLTHEASELERVFNCCFLQSTQTRLIGGAAEPIYQPASEQHAEHRLYYREDYFASALHEVAHWCIAGSQRREQIDFGYWYVPQGRSAGVQRAFERVEIKPQALEWFFAKACDFAFGVSVDNFDPVTGEQPDSRDFKDAVYQQAISWQQRGLPQRAQQFFQALCAAYGSKEKAENLQFKRSELD